MEVSDRWLGRSLPSDPYGSLRPRGRLGWGGVGEGHVSANLYN